MDNAFLLVINALQVLTSTDKVVCLVHLVMMVKYGINLSLNVSVLLIHSGTAINASNVMVVKSIKMQAVSVLQVCSGTATDVN